MDFESSGCAFDPRRGHLRFMSDLSSDLQLIHILAERLERISVDSIWAHRASGLRGSLIRAMEQLETGENVHPQTLGNLYQMGFYILEQAARAK